MLLYLAKDGAQTGPFSEEQVRAMMAGGVISPQDYCWHEGLPGWVAIGQVLRPAASMPFPAAAPAQARPYAGFWLRVVAFIIDNLLLYVVYQVVLFTLNFGVSVSDSAALLVAGVMGFFINILGSWLYHALMESSAKQATLGKMALGLIVTDMQGQRLTFGRATGRYFGSLLSSFLLCIGYLMCVWTERKQCLHDIMAGTLVVRK
ncbi:MAG: hypothetical protein RJA22_2951 [Verrucomicrobiota bacterium]|jgi:uncharacterized RDD family membrane protein YckC